MQLLYRMEKAFWMRAYYKFILPELLFREHRAKKGLTPTTRDGILFEYPLEK